MIRFLIATDAYEPQVNGVVRTYQRLFEELDLLGHAVHFITPNDFITFPCPTYPEIRLSVASAGSVGKMIDRAAPDAVHIATEGPIGWAARRACLRRNIPFTTAYHTRFPEYVVKRFPIPVSWLYGLMKQFHNSGQGTMVATSSLVDELTQKGFEKVIPWTRGVDTTLFRPRDCRKFGKDPVALYVGRVAVEKNLEAFLEMSFEGTKVVVGDGPSLDHFKTTYDDVVFTGSMAGEALAACYSSADVFVFPSLTDTFGIVMLEAMASGLPIAAFPVTGPIDVVQQGTTGFLSESLPEAVSEALKLDRDLCREHALAFSWERCASMFIENLKHAGCLSTASV